MDVVVGHVDQTLDLICEIENLAGDQGEMLEQHLDVFPQARRGPGTLDEFTILVEDRFDGVIVELLEQRCPLTCDRAVGRAEGLHGSLVIFAVGFKAGNHGLRHAAIFTRHHCEFFELGGGGGQLIGDRGARGRHHGADFALDRRAHDFLFRRNDFRGEQMFQLLDTAFGQQVIVIAHTREQRFLRRYCHDVRAWHRQQVRRRFDLAINVCGNLFGRF